MAMQGYIDQDGNWHEPEEDDDSPYAPPNADGSRWAPTPSGRETPEAYFSEPTTNSRTYTPEEADFLRRNPGDEGRMAAALASGGGGGSNVVQSWSGGSQGGNSGSSGPPDWYRTMLEQTQAQAQAAAAQNKARNDALYAQLLGRSQQSLAVGRNDPVIRAQADAYSANAQRESRNYLGDIAESSGPYANLRGEQRIQAEKLGQATGGFEAQLMGRELTARRDEIAQALSGMAGLLSQDQENGLRRELAILDQGIKEQQLAQGDRGLDMDWQRALMGNDQFMRQLGLNQWDRENYWDYTRSRA